MPIWDRIRRLIYEVVYQLLRPIYAAIRAVQRSIMLIDRVIESTARKIVFTAITPFRRWVEAKFLDVLKRIGDIWRDIGKLWDGIRQIPRLLAQIRTEILRRVWQVVRPYAEKLVQGAIRYLKTYIQPYINALTFVQQKIIPKVERSIEAVRSFAVEIKKGLDALGSELRQSIKRISNWIIRVEKNPILWILIIITPTEKQLEEEWRTEREPTLPY